jgi:hypothetical protein
MSNNLKYQTWHANKAICRSLHQFSEKLPDKLRAEYLAMLEEIVTKQKSLVANQNGTETECPSRGRAFFRPLMRYFGFGN